jgi:Zn-dependent alcohol dehydrogenases, class III
MSENFDLKMRGTRPDGSTLMSQHGKPVYSAFFQQSSFATHAIANERFAVKVANEAPLDLLGRWPAADKPAPARCSTRCSRGRATHSPCSVSGPSGCQH